MPTWQLLGDRAGDSFRPYASLLPKADGDFDEFSQTLVDQAIWARDLGFAAAKLELLINGPYAHSGLDIPDARMIETIAGVRDTVGPDFAIMVDVAYAWDDVEHALEVIESWADLDVFFVETPLWPTTSRATRSSRGGRRRGSRPGSGWPRGSSSST